MLMKKINTSTRFSIVDLLCERSMPTHYRCVIKKQTNCSYKKNIKKINLREIFWHPRKKIDPRRNLLYPRDPRRHEPTTKYFRPTRPTR